ncbi:hypothetical protein CAK95_17980 [Pseudorhodoplanes sinuspersici]|uniref:Acyltransferase n=1 Tax=Pseudorhodoplanes sinuspersici TaxID=1235591 RepID=A0A1W6ZTW7_9HYPH|nr:hypothetical protein CAK95_17980 [Pseudorhodoplanes sinuspersici]
MSVAEHRLRYRPEIDGLRAVAVVPVIFFHAGFTGFSGGFVGVDIFFVISGYLITSIIVAELEAGHFSLRAFYERRARRILPALFLVTLTCIPFALMWMPPEQLKSFGKSVVAVALFVSNIFFWSEAGYFTAAVDEKPLLHTWSLAIEEQYYLIFPLLMILCWPLGSRRIVLLIFLSIIPSFALAQVGSYRWPDATFFLIFSRSWELAIGGLIAFYLKAPMASGRVIRELMSFIGIGLIVWAIIFYSGKTPYPGIYALTPTLGAALIIVFAAPGTILGTILSMRPLVSIGLISYSLYLWHQPLLAFSRVIFSGRQSTPLLLGLIALCVVLSYLSWRFIEKPARKVVFRPSIMAGAAIASVLVAGLGLLAAYGNIGRSFTPVQLAQMAPPNANRDPRLLTCPPAPGSRHDFRACSQNPALKRKAVLYGDSHAGALYLDLAAALSQHGIDLVLLRNGERGARRFECQPLPGNFRYGQFEPDMKARCADQEREVARIANVLGAEYLFVSLRYTFRLFPATGAVDELEYDNGEGGVGDEGFRQYFVLGTKGEVSFSAEDKFTATTNAFRSLIDLFSGRTVLVGPVPEVGWRVENRNRSSILLFGAAEQTISTDYVRFKQRNQFANRILQNIEGHKGALLVQPSDVFCDRLVAGRCVAQLNAVPLYRDDDHLAYDGAKMLSRYIVEQLQARNALR